MAEQPHIYVLGGPNGAGKSTVASVLLPESLGVHQFVNADLIAKGLSPFAPESAELAAGRIMIERMYALRSRGQSFGFESTLASKSPVRFLQDAKALGYLVDIAFLWVDSVTLAQARVRGRVAAGGHDIPPEVVERRYWRGIRNFFRLYQPLADAWTVCDNSGPELVVVAQGSSGTSATIMDAGLFDRMRDQADAP